MEFIKTTSGKLINKAFIACADDWTITTSDGKVYEVDEYAFFEPSCYVTIPATSDDIAILCEVWIEPSGEVQHRLCREKIIAWRIEDLLTFPLLSCPVDDTPVALMLPDGNVRGFYDESRKSIDEFVRESIDSFMEKHGNKFIGNARKAE